VDHLPDEKRHALAWSLAWIYRAAGVEVVRETLDLLAPPGTTQTRLEEDRVVFSVEDNQRVTYRLTAQNGTLGLGGATIPQGLTVTGAGGRALTLTGSEADINGVLASLTWAWLVHWRVGRHRAAIWKSLVLPAAGAALCWLLLTTLWMPALDYARSYLPLVRRIESTVASRPMPADIWLEPWPGGWLWLSLRAST